MQENSLKMTEDQTCYDVCPMGPATVNIFHFSSCLMGGGGGQSLFGMFCIFSNLFSFNCLIVHKTAALMKPLHIDPVVQVNRHEKRSRHPDAV